ncbi:MAG: hypothetical protein HC913_20090 [Microscillaceae bacterium]|nr:hypothetical protein [Microscillaceae bacterium]
MDGFGFAGLRPGEYAKARQRKPPLCDHGCFRTVFKNVRQIYYDLEVQPATQLHIYRFKNREQVAQNQPIINLALVHNWRYDEAYILIEPNGFFENSRNLEINWQNGSNPSQKGRLSFQAGNKATHFKFAVELYEAITQNNNLFIRQQGRDFPILKDDRQREAFRRTMVDYFKLIGVE